jgi:hypothetical protein
MSARAIPPSPLVSSVESVQMLWTIYLPTVNNNNNNKTADMQTSAVGQSVDPAEIQILNLEPH